MEEIQLMRLVAGIACLAILWPAMRRMPRDGLGVKIAAWLAIFIVLGLIYDQFGPF